MSKLALSPAHAEWLETERHLPVELSAEMGIVSQSNAIGFVYRKNGKPTHVKWRALDKSKMWQQPSGFEPYLWNLDALTEQSGKGQTLIITEGEFDCVAWSATGQIAVSVPNGANSSKPGTGDIVPTNDGGFSYLWSGSKLNPDIAKFDRVILSTDDDEPGRVLRDELSVRIGPSKCYWIKYPDGCKDANDVLRLHGMEGLGALYRSAKPMVADRLVSFADIPERDGVDGVTTGWAGLDKHMRLLPPELVVVTGTAGAGKSEWTLSLAAGLARVHGWRGAILQFEDQPDRLRGSLRNYARTWSADRNKKNCIELQPDDWINQMFMTIPPPVADDAHQTMNLEWLSNVITEAGTRHGCKWVVIDPWNEVEHIWARGESETTYISRALSDLKRLASKLQIVVIIVTHPSKSGSEKGWSDMSLRDVSGSHTWDTKADHGVIIWRESPSSSEVVVKVSKCKRHEVMGFPGAVTMEFDRRSGTYRVTGSP